MVEPRVNMVVVGGGGVWIIGGYIDSGRWNSL